MSLCLHDLAEVTGGVVRFGSPPPVAGLWTAIGAIALDSRLVQPGEIFWRLPGLPCQTACSSQHALFRGAAGIVAPVCEVAPWPGRFCVEVERPLAALAALLDRLEGEGLGQDSQELKVLQLWASQAPVNTPPTCGREASEQLRSRCRRRAA